MEWVGIGKKSEQIIDKENTKITNKLPKPSVSEQLANKIYNCNSKEV